jgi:3-methyladenine DNA glycosylase AlkD
MLETVRTLLEPLRDPSRAAPMAAYMKNNFAFLGIPTPQRVAALKPMWKAWKPSRLEVLTLVGDLWAQAEREYQYAAFGALERHWTLLESDDLEDVCALVATRKAWWDTIDSVDGIAGLMVKRDPSLETLMDAFAVHDNVWLRRIAIQHQLGYGPSTDAERLFRYAVLNAAHESFWVRKSLGWALREYAKHDPDAVRAFFGEHRAKFSTLTVREALKHLEPR